MEKRKGKLMQPIYLRKEKTDDTTLLRANVKMRSVHRDVVAYTATGGAPMARWTWWGSKPTRRNKRVMLDCVTRPVIWLADLPVA